MQAKFPTNLVEEDCIVLLHGMPQFFSAKMILCVSSADLETTSEDFLASSNASKQ